MKSDPQMLRPSGLSQLITWTFFILAFLSAWNVSSAAALKKFEEQTDISQRVRRPFIIVVGMYAYVYACLHIVIISLVAYSLCAIFCMGSVYVPEVAEKFIRRTLHPEVVFHCISLENLMIHAIMFVVMMIGVIALSCGYIKEKDLEGDADKMLRHKTVRMILLLAAVMLVGYLAYAIYSISCGKTLDGKLELLSAAVRSD